jgi:hypothetical protein
MVTNSWYYVYQTLALKFHTLWENQEIDTVCDKFKNLREFWKFVLVIKQKGRNIGIPEKMLVRYRYFYR